MFILLQSRVLVSLNGIPCQLLSQRICGRSANLRLISPRRYWLMNHLNSNHAHSLSVLLEFASHRQKQVRLWPSRQGVRNSSNKMHGTLHKWIIIHATRLKTKFARINKLSYRFEYKMDLTVREKLMLLRSVCLRAGIQVTIYWYRMAFDLFIQLLLCMLRSTREIMISPSLEPFSPGFVSAYICIFSLIVIRSAHVHKSTRVNYLCSWINLCFWFCSDDVLGLFPVIKSNIPRSRGCRECQFAFICVFVFICVCLCIHMCVSLYSYVRVSVFICVSLYSYVCVSVFICVCLCIHMCVPLYSYVCVSVFICVCLCIHMSVSLY